VRNWIVKTTLSGLALTTVMATSAMAQDPSSTSGGIRIGGGLSIQFDGGFSGPRGIGVTGDVRGNLKTVGAKGSIGWVGDVSFHTFSDPDFTTVGILGGVAYNLQPLDGLSLYAQFLLGVERCCDGTNALAVQPGGGLNIRMTSGVDLRVGIDFRWAKYLQGWFPTPRLWFGASFRLGGA
jgi:hypothetical protein